MRRIVTGHKGGKSVIVDDVEISPGSDSTWPNLAELWATESTPVIPVGESDYKKRLSVEIPRPGETRVRIAWLYPDNETLKEAKERGFDLVGFWREAFKDDYGMHTTDTIDYDIILSGELWMELDDGVEVHVEPGDCVIQNGTRHAWRNRGSQPCIMASVMVGAKRK